MNFTHKEPAKKTMGRENLEEPREEEKVSEQSSFTLSYKLQSITELLERT